VLICIAIWRNLRILRTRSPRRGAVANPVSKCARDWRGGATAGGHRPRRSRGGTPAKPGFRRSRKCAQLLIVGCYRHHSRPRRGKPPPVHVVPPPPRLHGRWLLPLAPPLPKGDTAARSCCAAPASPPRQVAVTVSFPSPEGRYRRPFLLRRSQGKPLRGPPRQAVANPADLLLEFATQTPCLGYLMMRGWRGIVVV
jgi:hypothetical protein